MVTRHFASSLCAALLVVTAQQASAQAFSKDQWRVGLGQVNTPYTNPQNAAVGPASNALVEVGWSRDLGGPWSLRAGFIHALDTHRHTQRSTTFLSGRTQLTDVDSSTHANVFQLGVGLAVADGSWGKLTATGMLTHTRGTVSSVVTDTYQGGGQSDQQTISSASSKSNLNRFTLGLEYQLPFIQVLGGFSPYVHLQKLTSDNGAGGKQTFITAGLIKPF